MLNYFTDSMLRVTLMKTDEKKVSYLVQISVIYFLSND